MPVVKLKTFLQTNHAIKIKMEFKFFVYLRREQKIVMSLLSQADYRTGSYNFKFNFLNSLFFIYKFLCVSVNTVSKGDFDCPFLPKKVS